MNSDVKNQFRSFLRNKDKISTLRTNADFVNSSMANEMAQKTEQRRSSQYDRTDPRKLS